MTVLHERCCQYVLNLYRKRLGWISRWYSPYRHMHGIPQVVRIHKHIRYIVANKTKSMRKDTRVPGVFVENILGVRYTHTYVYIRYYYVRPYVFRCSFVSPSASFPIRAILVVKKFEKNTPYAIIVGNRHVAERPWLRGIWFP